MVSLPSKFVLSEYWCYEKVEHSFGTLRVSWVQIRSVLGVVLVRACLVVVALPALLQEQSKPNNIFVVWIWRQAWGSAATINQRYGRSASSNEYLWGLNLDWWPSDSSTALTHRIILCGFAYALTRAIWTEKWLGIRCEETLVTVLQQSINVTAVLQAQMSSYAGAGVSKFGLVTQRLFQRHWPKA